MMPTPPSDSDLASPRQRTSSLTPVDGVLTLAVALIIGLWLYTRSLESPADLEHAHPVGAQGGVIIGFDRDRYHAEVWVEPDGVLRLMTLGRSPSEIIDVESQALVAYVAGGAGETVAVPLRPEPQPGDGSGRTSQFAGRLPSQLTGRPIQATVAALQIDGRRYRFGFAWPAEAAHQLPMPDKVQDEAERELYLEPGGMYTAADIEANGQLTASAAFVGFKAQHDFAPRPGDRLCPVTRTKANPDCGWIIGGQRYTFCCPPCIDEFLALAKAEPDQVQSPESYVKQ